MLTPLQQLRLYLNTFNDDDDRVWCSCGDEVIHAPPHNDPPYVDDCGQYCCELCAELKWSKINGIPSFDELCERDRREREAR